MTKNSKLFKINRIFQKSNQRITIFAVIFFVIGLSAAVYLHWPALTNYTTYKGDIRQAVHWTAYHQDTFRSDDLLVKYAEYNESPLQNLIYYVGTFFIDMVRLTKIIAVVSYGFCTLLFFILGYKLFGLFGGGLSALFFTFFPDQFTFFVGGFSKAWMIPLIMLCLYLLDKEKWRGISILIPFAACAYPMAAVLIGLTTIIYIILRFFKEIKLALPALLTVIPGAFCGLIILMSKYISPPEFIGTMRPKSELLTMPEMYRGGLNHYLPVPDIFEELVSHLYNPFIIGISIMFFIILRRGVLWRKSWTALSIASIIGYIVSDWLFMELYIPNRYTRYSIAVLLILWQSQNLNIVLKKISIKRVKIVVLIIIVGLASIQYRDDFNKGEQTVNRKRLEPLCEFLHTLPGDVLIATHPFLMDDIPIQARRSVLCNYKMAHPWFTTYYDEIKERSLRTFDALYANDHDMVNYINKTYGVTHLVVSNKAYMPEYLERENIYVNPYNEYIRGLININRFFILSTPPPESIIYRDKYYTVLELPL